MSIEHENTIREQIYYNQENLPNCKKKLRKLIFLNPEDKTIKMPLFQFNVGEDFGGKTVKKCK